MSGLQVIRYPVLSHFIILEEIPHVDEKVSRAGFYRFPPDRSGGDAEVELRDAMQRIALEFPSYGWPRMTEELKRRGWAVNHKRVYRVMREDNLLCLRRRTFVATTDSAHTLPVYLNLAREMTLTGLDQLWVADITYIRLRCEFVYLAVILDAFSRRVIGWALDRTLEDTWLKVEKKNLRNWRDTFCVGLNAGHILGFDPR